MTRSSTRFFVAALVLLGSAAPTFAHHPTGGKLPATLWHGFLSGVGHPIIGIDHLAFIIAVGVVAALSGSLFLIAISFVGATLAGAGLHLAGVSLPAPELIIAASVVAIGALLMSKSRSSAEVLAAFVALAGLFHGYAYAESIFGAEQTPLMAYLIGFSAVQLAIVSATALFARRLLATGEQALTSPRLAGAMIAGVGLALLATRLEGLLLPMPVTG